MQVIKKGDFVKLQYTGTIRETGLVFDTTSAERAEEHHIHAENARYGPVTICVGEGQLLPALDDALIGKEPDAEFRVDIPVEKAFGRKDPKLLQLIATSKFTKNQIQPQPGLRVTIDGSEGVVRSVGSGRTVVDFNHPLAGKDLIYDLRVEGLVTEDKERIAGYFALLLGKEISFTFENDTVTITEKVPGSFPEVLGRELTRLLGRQITVKAAEKQAEKKA